MYRLEINEDELSPLILRLQAGLDDMTPVMQDLGELLLQSTQDRMLRGEQPNGAPFAPRSPVTLKHYAAKGFKFGSQPLNKSGEMRQQLAYEATADGISWGSNAIQSAVMQFGADKGAFGTNAQGKPIPWGNIPARPFLGVSAEDRTGIVEELEDWLMDLSQRGD
ncbi:phage virion morphogenesis protein [Phaeobacter inhibens]|uniref:phage virion morphogenesis protein n=1 Tax=Phaeobacter inhibens TaxID=221822 RepID=UPI00076BB206|nr:phage virion morphogenesis protein [Phaeobacter inhibens]KXF92095.1 phage morphogenesis protein [Phaeobacter inhibens]WHP69931.1 phage virion morphogenesis protein [Phaeobacter inhibens]